MPGRSDGGWRSGASAAAGSTRIVPHSSQLFTGLVICLTGARSRTVSPVQCESFNGMVGLVARTDMLAILSRRMLTHPLARDLLQEIPVSERMPSITHGIYSRADAPPTPAAAAMAKAITAVARGLARRAS